MSEIDTSNVLLPGGEASITDTEFELVQYLLEKHIKLVETTLIKIKHVRGED